MDRRQTKDKVKEKTVSQPSTRISRLIQPRKYSATPHSLRGNRSSSQENLSQSNRQANKRARSATPLMRSETPIRPPLARSLSSLFTPASINRSTALTNRSTALKNSEQTARILEVLRHHFGPTFLSGPGGLQSMSAKQFVEIIRFFAQSIIGDKVVIQDNSVDDVKLFVDFMEYPHQMNKSWFKAPTVSIAYDRNVEFLDWLCDFVAIGDADNIIDDIECKDTESESMVDQDFVASFVGDLRNGFAVWSDEKAEFDGWKLNWIREMLHSKTGLDDIDGYIGRMQSEYTMLQTKQAPFGDEHHLLQKQQKKLDELRKEVARDRAICNEKNADAEDTSDEMNSLTAKNQQLRSTVQEMKEKIKNQPVSAEGRQKLLADHSHKMHLLDEKNVFVASLKAISDDSQVKIARLKNQKTSKIFAINAIVEKVFQLGFKVGDMTIEQLFINESDTQAAIKVKIKLFTRAGEILNARRADIHASVKEAQSQLTSISNALFVVENEVAGLKKHLHTLEIQLQKMDNQIVETQHESEQQQQQLQVTINKTAEEINEMQLKILNKDKMVESLKAENKSIYEGIQIKTDALLKTKRERQERHEAAIAELEQVTGELTEAVKDFK